jgi:hypothetical protein
MAASQVYTQNFLFEGGGSEPEAMCIIICI